MQDSPHTPIPDQATVPPPVALRAGQDVVLGSPAPGHSARAIDWVRAAAHVAVRLIARNAGLRGVVFGGLAVAMGLGALQQPEAPLRRLAVVAVAYGITLTGTSAFLRARPSHSAFMVSIAQSAAFALAMVVASGLYAIIPAGLAMGWAMRRWENAQAYQKVMALEVPANAVALVQQVVEELRSRRALAAPDVIELTLAFGRDSTRWRIRLLPDVGIAVLFTLGETEVRPMPRLAFAITPEGNTDRRTVGVNVRWGDDSIAGRISCEHYQRYQAWQAGTMPEEVRAAIKGPNP